MTYYDQFLHWWDGTAWQPSSVAPIDAIAIPSTNIATSTSLALSKTTINSGEAVTLTATVTGASAGSVKCTNTSGGPALSVTDAAPPWTTSYSPTSTAKVKAAYLANGNYLGSTSTEKTITVKQKVTKTYKQSSRSGYQWRQSSTPFEVESTFTVGSSGQIPYTSFTITGIRLQVARYHAGSGSTSITAHVANSSGSILQSATLSVGGASGSDTPLSPTFNLTDFTVTSGTYRIGFTRDGAYQTQWDEYSAGGTLYYDGSSQGTGSLLWEIDGYAWV